MFDEEKRIEEEIAEKITPSTEEVEPTDTTSELPADTEVSDKIESGKETEKSDGGEGGDVTDEVSTKQSDSSDEEKDRNGEKEEPLDSKDPTKLDTEEEKDLSLQEDIEKTDEIIEDICNKQIKGNKKAADYELHCKFSGCAVFPFRQVVFRNSQKATAAAAATLREST